MHRSRSCALDRDTLEGSENVGMSLTVPESGLPRRRWEPLAGWQEAAPRLRAGVSCGWMSPAGGSTRISHEISKWIHPQGTREAVALTSVIVADDPEGIHLRVLRAADIARRGLGGHAEEVDDLGAEHLTRQHIGHARWVRCQGVGRDPTDGLGEGDDAGACEV